MYLLTAKEADVVVYKYIECDRRYIKKIKF
jgi:hypothetical protein